MWFQMLLTDGVLPSAIMTHMVKVYQLSKSLRIWMGQLAMK